MVGLPIHNAAIPVAGLGALPQPMIEGSNASGLCASPDALGESNLAGAQVSVGSPLNGPCESGERLRLLGSATSFAHYLVGRWPQVDDKGRLNYSFAGSLSTMLLAQAENFTAVDLDASSRPVFAETTSIPAAVRGALIAFARQIGDLDFVPTDHYFDNPGRLRKGGGGPAFAEIPSEALACLKIAHEGHLRLMCDPVGIGSHALRPPVKILLDGMAFYVTRPDVMLGFKVLHLLESYGQKYEKFNADFAVLLGAVAMLYSEEDLVQLAYDIVSKSHERTMRTMKAIVPNYRSRTPEEMEAVLSHPSVTPEIISFLRLLKQRDDGGIFLTTAEPDPEPAKEVAAPEPQPEPPIVAPSPPTRPIDIPVPVDGMNAKDIPHVW
ncbi:MAG: hypothetical protein AB1664_19235 [Thermodesulfobacteriota bacterium]